MVRGKPHVREGKHYERLTTPSQVEWESRPALKEDKGGSAYNSGVRKAIRSPCKKNVKEARVLIS